MLPTKFSFVIQAGGESSRMGGVDKGLLPLRGRPLVQHILDQVKGFGCETIIISNHPESYQYLGFSVFRDIYPGKGALGGLYSAIHYSKEPYCVVLACDMPFLNRPFLEYLVRHAPDYDAVVPDIQSNGYIEPFRAIYSKRCLPTIQAALEINRFRIQDTLADLAVRYIDESEISKIVDLKKLFFNINTLTDLDLASDLING
jgi:molybdopterin-guanine dinucleotide biosynthesis protein A